MLRIYVASSWRNARQPSVVEALRSDGHQVYDFRNPEPGDNGFHWSEIDPAWETWTGAELRKALSAPIAREGFQKDYEALCNCDACVLVLPSGRSAHTEAGIAVGLDKPTFVLLDEHQEPELMYRAFDQLCLDLEELRACLAGLACDLDDPC